MTSDFSDRVQVTLVLHPRDHAELLAAWRSMFERFDEMRRQLAATLQPALEQLRPMLEQLQRLTGAAPPTDPRERALWLRRNRNTGPRRPLRGPRRVDPGRGLSVMAAGRPQYRPAR